MEEASKRGRGGEGERKVGENGVGEGEGGGPALYRFCMFRLDVSGYKVTGVGSGCIFMYGLIFIAR